MMGRGKKGREEGKGKKGVRRDWKEGKGKTGRGKKGGERRDW